MASELQDAIERDKVKEKGRLYFRPTMCASNKSFRHMLISILAQWVGLVGKEVREFGVDCVTKRGKSHLRMFYSGDKQLCAIVNPSGIHMVDIHNCICIVQGMTICPEEDSFERLVHLMVQGEYKLLVSLSYWIECQCAESKQNGDWMAYPTSSSALPVQVEKRISQMINTL